MPSMWQLRRRSIGPRHRLRGTAGAGAAAVVRGTGRAVGDRVIRACSKQASGKHKGVIKITS